MTTFTTGKAFILGVPQLHLQKINLVEAQLDLRVGPATNLMDGVVAHELLSPHILFFPEYALYDGKQFDDFVHLGPLWSFASMVPVFLKSTGDIVGPADIKAVMLKCEYVDVLLWFFDCSATHS